MDHLLDTISAIIEPAIKYVIQVIPLKKGIQQTNCYRQTCPSSGLYVYLPQKYECAPTDDVFSMFCFVKIAI